MPYWTPLYSISLQTTMFIQYIKSVLSCIRLWMEDCPFFWVCESCFVLDLFVNGRFTKRTYIYFFQLGSASCLFRGWQSAGWNERLKEVPGKKAPCNINVFRKTTGNKIFIASLNVCLYAALSGSSYSVRATLVFNLVLSRELQ